MKELLKILKWTAIVILSLSVVLFSASIILQDKVAEIIVKSLSKSISTKPEFGSLKLSLIKKFPKASLEFTDVLIHSSDNFNGSAFRGINTDTLIAAKIVTVEFSIRDMLKGVYNIERISASTGKINLFSDTTGIVNYDITVKNQESSGEDFTINLERITISDIAASYNNLATQVKIKALIENGKIKSRITGEIIDFSTTADLTINHFQIYNTSVSKPVSAAIDLKLQNSSKGILFEKSTMKIDNYIFGLSGSVSNENFLDLIVNGDKINISTFKKYLPEKYMTMVSDYNPSGILTVNSKIKGTISRVSNPHIEIDYSLQDGRVTFGKSVLTINSLSFVGNFTNGRYNNFSTSSINVTDLKARLGSADYSGSFSVTDFNKPVTSLSIKGKVIPAEIKEFFNVEVITSARGSVDLDLNVKGAIPFNKKPSVSEIIDLKPTAELSFNSLSISLKKDDYRFNNVNGLLSFSDDLTTGNLDFYYKGQRIKIAGEFQNLPEWVTGRRVQLIANADISLNRLIPERLQKEFADSKKLTTGPTAFRLPNDIAVDLKFSIDTFIYKTFSSTGINGTLNYKPGLLTFKSLNMEGMNGALAGAGFVVQNKNLSVIAKGIFNVNNVDVKKAFTAFHNFGQDFIKAENLEGSLSGSLSLLLPMDSMLKPQIKSITAEGKYVLVNGALVNFEPVKELSDFIELSELENIHFEKLENDFFIKNNFLYVPQMDVKSSAADLSINGKHSFDNDYEYHVKMLLSEILSKKRKKNKSNNTEFGVVQDDGLGRTSILLKIIGAGDNLKVSYDMKAAGAVVKNNIKSERQTLKTILNQEYGWYKKDSAAAPKPAEKKKKFNIVFDEPDTVKQEATPVKKKKTE